MAVHLNHTIVASRSREESSQFWSEVLGLTAPTPFGPFLEVTVDNGVTFDFSEAGDEAIVSQHYAFLITESEFDEIFGRIQDRGVRYWADPGRQKPGTINRNDGGRGVYFEDPSGHFLEVITRPYGRDD